MKLKLVTPATIVLTVVMLIGAVAASAAPRTWRVVAVASGAPAPAGLLTCPSSAECLGVDQGGGLVISTDPTATVPSWRTLAVDAGAVTSVACPSSNLCVALDQTGDVLTSVDPAVDDSWQLGVLVSDTSQPLFGLSCSSTALCVAVGEAGVAFTDDPAAGSSSWVVQAVGQVPGAPGCGAVFGGHCVPGYLESVSCPANALCEASGFSVAPIASFDPGNVTGWPATVSSGSDFYYSSVQCTSASECLMLCRTDLMAATCPASYGPRDVIMFDPSSPEAQRDVAVTNADLDLGLALGGLWCVPGPTCFVSAYSGALLASSDPDDPAGPWTVFRPAISPETTSSAIVSIACPSASACLAVTQAGQLIMGSPPLAGSALSTALIASVRTAAGAPSRTTLRSTHWWRTYREDVGIWTAGRLTVVWEQRGTGTVIARFSQAFEEVGTFPATLTFTKRGMGMLARGHRLKIDAVAHFTPFQAPAVTAQHDFSL